MSIVSVKKCQGRTEWYLDDVLHREDGPAIEFENGCEKWFQHGVLHRKDGPAVIESTMKCWFVNGFLHRDDGPAYVDTNIRSWYRHGVQHRVDGPATIYANGSEFWIRNGEYHREDGPAVKDAHSSTVWYLNGKRHRKDGPAVIHRNGSKEWWIYGEQISQKEFEESLSQARPTALVSLKNFSGTLEIDDRIERRRDGKLHSNDGLPAIEFANGDKHWCKDGILHREDGPAIIEQKSGNKEWHLNGILQYKVSKWGISTEYWYNSMGAQHREDGPAVDHLDGTGEWLVNGTRHREDGPAIVYKNGDKKWYRIGYLHRADGPAVEYANGHTEWWINGKNLTQEEFEQRGAPKHNIIDESKPNQVLSKTNFGLNFVNHTHANKQEEPIKPILNEGITKKFALHTITKLLCEYPELMGKTTDMIVSAEAHQQVEIGEGIC